MKPKWQEDSSCVFACHFCRGTCHRRDTAGIESAPKSIRRRSRKKLCKSRQDDTAGKSSRERQAPALYAAVRVRRRSYGVSRIPRSVAGRITGHRRSLPQPSSAAWCPPPLHLIFCLQLLGDALRLYHLLYQQFQHLSCLPIYLV